MFWNRGIAYEVWSSFDRIAEIMGVEGGVTVLDGQTTLATLTCDPGSVSRELIIISDLKSDTGKGQDFDSLS